MSKSPGHKHTNSSSHPAMATLKVQAIAAANKGGTLVLHEESDQGPMILPWASLLSTSKLAPSMDLFDDEVLIGRKQKANSLCINHQAISGVHCRVYRKEAKKPWEICVGDDVPAAPIVQAEPEPEPESEKKDEKKKKGGIMSKLKSLFNDKDKKKDEAQPNEEIEDETIEWKGTKNATLSRDSTKTQKRYETWLEDLSTNGTYLENHKMGTGVKKELHSGAEITLLPGRAGQDKISYVLIVHGESPRESDEPEPAPEGQVTLVFTDIESSTNLWETGGNAMNLALEQHDLIIRTLLSKFRGYEVKTEGDAFFVAFWSVIDAVKWCLAVQHALLRTVWPAEITAIPAGGKVQHASGLTTFNGLRVRMGVHTGMPNCRRNPTTNRMDYFGRPVNTAARISDAGHGGQIVCSKEVYDEIQKEIQREKNAPSESSSTPETVAASPQRKATAEIAESSGGTKQLNFPASIEEDSAAPHPSALQHPTSEFDDYTSLENMDFLDCGKVNLKGLNEATQIYQISSQEISLRRWDPPLRAKSKAVGEAGE